MPPRLDHTIVLARDNQRGAEFLAGVLGVDVGPRSGPFVPVRLENGVTLDFQTVPGLPERSAHYAFLVSDAEFDQCFARLEASGTAYFADPFLRRPGSINHDDGGRGVYFLDPTGTTMELITRPYGGWHA